MDSSDRSPSNTGGDEAASKAAHLARGKSTKPKASHDKSALLKGPSPDIGKAKRQKKLLKEGLEVDEGVLQELGLKVDVPGKQELQVEKATGFVAGNKIEEQANPLTGAHVEPRQEK